MVAANTALKDPGRVENPDTQCICSDVLAGLYDTARINNTTDPEHFVFPWQGGKGKIDPTRRWLDGVRHGGPSLKRQVLRLAFTTYAKLR
jgi:hypothetical protein